MHVALKALQLKCISSCPVVQASLLCPASMPVHMKARTPTTHLRSIVIAALWMQQLGRAQPSADQEEMMQKMEEARNKREEATMYELLGKMQQDGNGGGDFGTGGMKGPPVPNSLTDVAKAGSSAPKQIGVKTARAFMKEIISALTTTDSREALNKARSKISMGEAFDFQTLVRALGSVIEKRTGPLVRKFGFASDFEQAVASVGDAQERKRDKELTAAMTHLNEIFMGTPPVGTLPELSPLATKFLDMSAPERKKALQQAQQMHDKATEHEQRANIGEYLQAMQGVISTGERHIQDSIDNVVANAKLMAKARAATDDEKGLFDARINLLSEFLRPQDKGEHEEL